MIVEINLIVYMDHHVNNCLPVHTRTIRTRQQLCEEKYMDYQRMAPIGCTNVHGPSAHINNYLNKSTWTIYKLGIIFLLTKKYILECNK